MDASAYPLHLYRWRVADPLRPGRRYVTRHHMSEADALATDPVAERIDSTLVVVEKPGQPHSSGDHGRIS